MVKGAFKRGMGSKKPLTDLPVEDETNEPTVAETQRTEQPTEEPTPTAEESRERTATPVDRYVFGDMPPAPRVDATEPQSVAEHESPAPRYVSSAQHETMQQPAVQPEQQVRYAQPDPQPIQQPQPMQPMQPMQPVQSVQPAQPAQQEQHRSDMSSSPLYTPEQPWYIARRRQTPVRQITVKITEEAYKTLRRITYEQECTMQAAVDAAIRFAYVDHRVDESTIPKEIR